jgi:hypothetical protein
MAFTPRQVEDFWKKVARRGPDECWAWTGAKSHRGYGVKLNRTGPEEKTMINAHRMAWIIANGPVSDGLLVCHSCDNRACCNVSHLFLGTAKENTADMLAKGRGSKPPLAMLKFSAEQVAEIHALHKAGNTMRSIGRLLGCGHSSVRKVLIGQGRYGQGTN